MEVDAAAFNNGVMIDNIYVPNKKMHTFFHEDSRVFAYLITCGFDSREAFQLLDQDYSLYHFQHLIGQQLLYTLGCQLHTTICEHMPEYRFFRCAIRMQNNFPDIDGNEHIDNPQYCWDPDLVKKILHLFGQNTLGIQVTNQGSFNPLHSIVGIVMGNKMTGERASRSILGMRME